MLKNGSLDLKSGFSVRWTAVDIGLIKVVKKDDVNSLQNYSFYADKSDNEVEMHSNITRDEFIKKHLNFFNRIRCYAALDENGWHEPGKMSWWGISSATPSSRNQFSNLFYETFVSSRKPSDWLVAVDCHI